LKPGLPSAKDRYRRISAAPSTSPLPQGVVRRWDEAIDLGGERARELDRCRSVPFAGDLQANWQIPLDKADRGGGRRTVALNS
jgi:hypothetical protein